MARLMIIDDDKELAENLASILTGEGHSVKVWHKMEGALDKIKEDKPELLILDVMFPDNPAAGFDLARSVRTTPEIAKLPIIHLTGVNQHFPMDFSSKDIDPDWMPVQDFIEKPVAPKVLIAKIKKML